MPQKKTLLDRMIDISFVLYVTSVFCLDDNADLYKVIYAAMILLCGFITLSILPNIKKMSLSAEMVLLILYGIYGFIISQKATYSVAMATTMSKTVSICILSTIIISLYFSSRQNTDIFPATIAFAGVVLSFYVIITYGGFGEFYHQASIEGDRLGDKVGQINEIGLRCSYTVIALFYYVIKEKKLWLIPFMIMPFVVGMGSGSRKALISIAFGCAMILLILSSGSKNMVGRVGKWIIAAIFILVIGTLLSKLPIMQTVIERMEGLFDLVTKGKGESSVNLRNRMIKAGIKGFREHPIFGVGFNNSSFINIRYTSHFVYLHNDYVEQLVNVGIVGFVLFYGNILLCLKKALERLKNGKKTYGLLLIFIIVFLINSVGCVQYYSKVTYVFLAYWISAVYTERRNEDASKPGY